MNEFFFRERYSEEDISLNNEMRDLRIQQLVKIYLTHDYTERYGDSTKLI